MSLEPAGWAEPLSGIGWDDSDFEPALKQCPACRKFYRTTWRLVISHFGNYVDAVWLEGPCSNCAYTIIRQELNWSARDARWRASLHREKQ